MKKLVNNHLRDGYSKFNLMFLKNYIGELDKNSLILDVGCGHLRNLKLFNEVGFKKLYGIDISIPDPKFKLNIKFTQSNIEKGLPYEDKMFDVVLCNFVLMFIDPLKIEFLLDELLRVTNKFLIIETLSLSNYTKTTEYKLNNCFELVCNHLEDTNDFEIIKKRNYYQKLILKRG